MVAVNGEAVSTLDEFAASLMAIKSEGAPATAATAPGRFGLAWEMDGFGGGPPKPIPDPPEPAPGPSGSLKLGAKGAQVEALQEILVQLGYLPPDSVSNWRGWVLLRSRRYAPGTPIATIL